MPHRFEVDDDFDIDDNMKGVSIGGAVAIGLVSLIIVWCCCARRRHAGRVIAPPASNVSAVIITSPNPPGPAPYPQQQYITARVPMPAPYPQVQQYPVQTAPYPVQQNPVEQYPPAQPYPAGFSDVQPTAPALNSLPPSYDQAVRQEYKH